MRRGDRTVMSLPDGLTVKLQSNGSLQGAQHSSGISTYRTDAGVGAGAGDARLRLEIIKHRPHGVTTLSDLHQGEEGIVKSNHGSRGGAGTNGTRGGVVPTFDSRW